MSRTRRNKDHTIRETDTHTYKIKKTRAERDQTRSNERVDKPEQSKRESSGELGAKVVVGRQQAGHRQTDDRIDGES